MANYPNFVLNDPKNMKDYYTQEQLDAMSDDDTLNTPVSYTHLDVYKRQVLY